MDNFSLDDWKRIRFRYRRQFNKNNNFSQSGGAGQP